MRVLFLLSLLIILAGNCLAQGWRGIHPLESTCEDVKRILKVEKCDSNSPYRFPDETVSIGFASCPCPIVCDTEYGGWDVPAGTVTGIRRQLFKLIPVSEFDVTSGKWKKTLTDMIGHVLYSDHEAGISLSAIDDMVESIRYYAPLEKSEHKLCPKCSAATKKPDTPSLWLIGYHDITFEEEKLRLDRFAAALEQNGAASSGYVVAFKRCGSGSNQILERAGRAKQYLVNTYGISSERIRIVDGGQRESSEIQLHVRGRRAPPPNTSSLIYPDQ